MNESSYVSFPLLPLYPTSQHSSEAAVDLFSPILLIAPSTSLEVAPPPFALTSPFPPLARFISSHRCQLMNAAGPLSHREPWPLRAELQRAGEHRDNRGRPLAPWRRAPRHAAQDGAVLAAARSRAAASKRQRSESSSSSWPRASAPVPPGLLQRAAGRARPMTVSNIAAKGAHFAAPQPRKCCAHGNVAAASAAALRDRFGRLAQQMGKQLAVNAKQNMGLALLSAAAEAGARLSKKGPVFRPVAGGRF